MWTLRLFLWVLSWATTMRENWLTSLTWSPVEDLESHKAFTNLGASVAGLRVDHTELQYNPGHPVVEKPHYHIHGMADSEAAEKAMK